ncbi:MAG TPA: class I tRNA ligase family protein, partial [Candidatus Saccharimonadales bacterium]
QIELIQKLEEKGFTYVIDDGVYYDTSKFPRYGDFARLDLDEQEAGKRVDFNPQKRNISDFALWKFSPTDHKRDMEWWAPWTRPGDSSDEQHVSGTRATHSSTMQGAGEQRTEPYQEYGKGAAETATQQSTESTTEVAGSAGQQGGAVHGSWGFPGWHIECSAMSMKYLGDTLDIHAGGIDHVPVHHTNEIAQSEAATGKQFAKHWMHSNHITIEGEKISKSLGNGITLEDIEKRGISLEAFRLHVLESHYRSQSKFSWESLQAAQNRLNDIYAWADLRHQTTLGAMDEELDLLFKTTREDILKALSDDLNTPMALASLGKLMDYMTNIELPSVDGIYSDGTLAFLESVFGLPLSNRPDITDEQKQLIAEREAARERKDWARSDELRSKLAKQNIGLRDTPPGAIWYRL